MQMIRKQRTKQFFGRKPSAYSVVRVELLLHLVTHRLMRTRARVSWTSARPVPIQNTINIGEKDSYLSGIQTRDPSNRAAADLRHRFRCIEQIKMYKPVTIVSNCSHK
jgi:hypothetical protein